MDAIQTLLKEFKDNKINEAQLEDQLAKVIEPDISSESDLKQQVSNLKDNYQLTQQTYDGVKTIVTESLSSKTRVKTDISGSSINTNSSANQNTQYENNPISNDVTRVLSDDNKTVVYTTQNDTNSNPGNSSASSSDNIETKFGNNTENSVKTNSTTNSHSAETIISGETSYGTRQELTHNYFDMNQGHSTSIELKPGSILKNRFILEQELGHGGMSIVYRALDLRKQEANNRNPYIAIKILGEAFKNHPQSIRVLEHESQKIQSLAHPNIITVYDFDRDGDAIYMTMECLQGESLDTFIHENKTGAPIEDVLPIVQAIGRALLYAHSKDIIHSDLKPENVFITKDNVVKVLDFGIARAKKMPDRKPDKDSDPASTSNTTNVTGNNYSDFDGSNLGALTPPYASPEMFEDADPDQRDDIYALGCVTYKLLTGRHPFNNQQADIAKREGLVPEKINELSRKQWQTLANSLAFDREERVATITEFLDGFIPKKRTLWFYGSIVGTSIALLISSYSWYSASQKPLLPQINLSIEQKQKVDDYFETAELYLSMGYLASPPGDSAFDQYQKVLDIDPTNQLAIEGKKEIAKRYITLATQKIDTGELEEGILLIKNGLIVEPDNKHLLDLQLKIHNQQTQQ